jgi:hypothetical protein
VKKLKKEKKKKEGSRKLTTKEELAIARAVKNGLPMTKEVNPPGHWESCGEYAT